jgi:hypothetical protein
MPVYRLVPTETKGEDSAPGPVEFFGKRFGPPKDNKWSVGELEVVLDPDRGRQPATSFPDPFFRREAMAAAIDTLKGPYLEHWNTLCQALAAGLLRVVPVDLLGSYGALGKCFVSLHGDRRFLSLLYASIDGRSRLVAVSDPEVLLWPAARGRKEEWAALKQQLQQATPERRPQELLADLRGLLRESKCWDPERIRWMRALDHLLGTRPPSADFGLYKEHARGVGPLALNLPQPADPKKQEQKPLYFPTMVPNWAGLVRKLASLSFTDESAQSLDGRDRNGLVQLRVSLPAGITEDEKRYGGLGVVERLTEHPPTWPKGVNLRGPEGLFRKAGSALYPSGALDPLAIRRLPVLHPDPVRVMVTALGAAGLPDQTLDASAGKPVSYGGQAIARALQGGFSLPDPAAIRDGDGGGFVLYGDSGEAKVYVERGAPMRIHELRDIGWVLWSTFVREPVEAEQGQQPALLMDGTPALRQGSDGRIEARLEHLVELDEEEREQAARRVATLQRFAASWQLQAEPASTGRSIRELLAAAAFAWVQWVTGKAPFRNGPRAKEELEWTLRGQRLIKLPNDCD